MILLYGATFGILMMSIVYALVRYLYSKELIYISYALMQLFSLLYIAAYSELFSLSAMTQDFALLLATLSAAVFAVAFYEGKFTPKITNYKELILNTLLLYIVILTAFYHYVLFQYLPYTVIYAILFISIIFNLKLRFKPTIVYVVGWSLLCVLLFIIDIEQYYAQEGYINIILIAFAIEAILFTTAISYKYNIIENLSSDHQNMLLQQSRLAQSGEMIANITHQFRQPLNNLSYILINLKKRRENGKLDDDYFRKKFEMAQDQLQFLSKTIDDFKEFYTPSKHKENFSLKEAIENSMRILSADLKNRNITLDFIWKADEEIELNGIKNELSQVILSLLSNAADALKGVEDPRIRVYVNASESEVTVTVEDNAGGIAKKDIDKIFEPYFSTKVSGSGIGLYLAKMIVEQSFEGKIEVTNRSEGAKFTLTLERAI